MKTHLVLPILIASLGLTACSPKSMQQEVKDNTTVSVEDAIIPNEPITILDGVDQEQAGKSAKNSEPTYEEEGDELVLTEDEPAATATPPQTLLQQNGEETSKSNRSRQAPSRRAAPAAPAIDRSRITVGSITASEETPRLNHARKFAPASITKLVTSGMALEKLGHDFKFRHRFSYRFVKGSTSSISILMWANDGDPTIGHSKFETDSARLGQLKRMVAELKAKGIVSIQGPVRLVPNSPREAAWFVADGVPDWEPYTCYGAPPRTHNIFSNCNGDSGLRNPEALAKTTLISVLRNAGITVNEAASVQSEAQLNGINFFTAPMPKLLYWMNKRSDNLIAESLFRAVADTQPGPNLQAAGQKFYADTITSWLTQAGAGQLISELRFLDGSGLSPNNQVTPRAFLQILKHYVPKSYFPDLWQSLPIAGVDGTLANRAKNPAIMGKVRAKTGTLTGYYQLAGYIPKLKADGKTVDRLVPFVILTAAPGNKAYARAARAYQDEVLVSLARKINER